MKLDALATVSYEEAAAMLEVSKTTLFGATSRGVLTPLPRRARKPGLLVKDQVKMFVGKDLSLRWLNSQEAVLWQEIKNAVESERGISTRQGPFNIDQFQEKAVFAGSLLEGTADIALDVLEEVIKALADDNVFTMDMLAEKIQNTPAFHRLMSLLGVNTEAIPQEGKKIVNDIARQVAERVQGKIAARFFKSTGEQLQALLPGLTPGQDEQRASSAEQDTEEPSQARAS